LRIFIKVFKRKIKAYKNGKQENLPYIPLYTGDWEKDCNVLSLESEAAWLRIIFKMFNSGKQSVYKILQKPYKIFGE